jgi:subtilase-type serine protease
MIRSLSPALIPLLVLMLLPGPFAAFGAAASADDYRMPEYLAGRGLDAIGAAEAYALGYSGKGVTVGVMDSNAFPRHAEFFQKSPYPVGWFTTPREGDWHGIHTAGTVAASRDGLGMHGVAYDANLVSMVGIDGQIASYERGEVNAEAIRAFRDYPEVSIISNSWTYGLALADWPGVLSFAADDTQQAATAMAELARESGSLFVFAAGNDGYASPNSPAALPAVMTGTKLIGGQTITIDYRAPFTDLSDADKRALSLNMLSVSAFDPASGRMRTITCR